MRTWTHEIIKNYLRLYVFFSFNILFYVARWLTVRSNDIKISIFPCFLLGRSPLFSNKIQKTTFFVFIFNILDSYSIKKIKNNQKNKQKMQNRGMSYATVCLKTLNHIYQTSVNVMMMQTKRHSTNFSREIN